MFKFHRNFIKKICSTCSHIKSVQKLVQSIQKFVQSVQIVQICSHKQSVQISSFHTHINNQSKFHYFIINFPTYSHMTNYPNFFISTMQKCFENASIKAQLPKHYHVTYNIISVTVYVSVNNNKH